MWYAEHSICRKAIRLSELRRGEVTPGSQDVEQALPVFGPEARDLVGELVNGVAHGALSLRRCLLVLSPDLVVQIVEVGQVQALHKSAQGDP